MVKQEISSSSSTMINHPHDDCNQFEARNRDFSLVMKTMEPPDRDRGPTQRSIIRTGSTPNSDVDYQEIDHNNSHYNQYATKKLKTDQQTGLTAEMNASNVTINNIINHGSNNTFDSATEITAIGEDEIRQEKNVISEQLAINQASLAVACIGSNQNLSPHGTIN